MAKAATKKSDTDKKKKPKPTAGATIRIKRKAKKAKSDGKKDGKSAGKGKSERKSALDGLAKLVDHPMVADLLAAGALAAVTVIAEQQLAKGKHSSSSKMVKDAGKAAAAAIGKKLMGDFGVIKDAATAAAKKA
ncbi:MAG: hypothetical protein LH465_02300 [Sphingomonas bacterium]|nr:hypothetical protein [Sphingomonas bacterium]